MARPTEFDRQQALDAALKLFWCQGYSATSLSDLLGAMGIGRGSFYAAFGDKRSLYIACLTLFANRTRDLLARSCDDLGPAQGLQKFFHHTLLEVPRHRASRGCLMVNTVLELADVDTELSALAAKLLTTMENDFATQFELAQSRGELHLTGTPQQLAASLMIINQGLRVASRKPGNRKALKTTIDNSLALVGLAA
jgi:TetR/AcrR family transcriptional repressor of nem operon